MRGKAERHYWYILVIPTNTEHPLPRFVTGIVGKEAFWEGDKPPMLFRDGEDARLTALGLMWNGSTAFPVDNAFEITSQPFKKDAYDLTFTATSISS